MNTEILRQRYAEKANTIKQLRAEIAQLKKQKEANKEEHEEVKQLRKENAKLKEELIHLDEKWNSKYYTLQQSYYAAKKFKDAMYKTIENEEVRKIRKRKEKEESKKSLFISKRETELKEMGYDEDAIEEIIDSEIDCLSEDSQFTDKRKYNGKHIDASDIQHHTETFDKLMSQPGGLHKALQYLQSLQ